MGRKLQPPAARVSARWARGGQVDRLQQGDRRASDRFWAPAPPEGSPVYLSERLGFSSSRWRSGRFSTLRRRRLPRLTGPTWPLPPPGQDVCLQPGSPAAPRARLPHPADPLGARAASSPKVVGQPVPLTPRPAAWVRLQSAAPEGGLRVWVSTSDLRRADCLLPLEGGSGARGAESRDTP